MPGLTGIISRNPDENKKRDLRAMMDVLSKEAWHNCGTYIDEGVGLYVGWVCHEGSFVDCMPIWNEQRNRCLFLFGEVFHDDSVAGNDARYLIRLFEERGDELFKSLNGFFHGVLVDIPKRTAILFNDRFGMQRLYLRETEDSLLFSAEAKAILKVQPGPRELNYRSLGQLLTMGCVLSGESLYRSIDLFPGASMWSFHGGKCLKKESYFNPREWEDQTCLGDQEFYERLKETFVSVLPRYYRDSDKIGVSLTGGLDTRIVMAYAASPPRTIPCYTFGSMYRDGFDVRVGRKVALACNQTHSTIKLGKEFLREFPSLARKAVCVSDGYLDAASGAAELFANREARKIAPIRMTGCHGSEVLRSVSGFKYKLMHRELFDDEFVRHLDHASDGFSESKKAHEVSFAAFVEAPCFNYNRMSVEQSQVMKRTPFMDNDLLALVYRAPRGAVASDRLSLRLVEDGNAQLFKIVTNRGVGGKSHGLFSRWRQGYHHILKLAEFAYDYDMPQVLSQVDHYLAPLHVEKCMLGWNGFYHFRKWFRDELSSYVEEILLDRRTMSRSYLKKGSMQRIVYGHIRKGHNYAREINAALTLELAHRALIDEIN